MTCKFIYFDIGNVLLSFCHERMCRQMAEVAGVKPQLVQQLLFHTDESDDFQTRFERGQVDAGDYYKQFCQWTKTEPDPIALSRAAADIFEPIEEVHELVLKLATRGRRLGLLSNCNSVHWAFFTDGRYPVLKSPGSTKSPFEIAIASQEVFVAKPDQKIFHIAIERSGVAAEQILFTDDLAENVAAAQSAGIDAVQFTGIEPLKLELTERGLLL